MHCFKFYLVSLVSVSKLMNLTEHQCLWLLSNKLTEDIAHDESF